MSSATALAPADILLVDDDLQQIQLMVQILRGLGRLRVATRADEALLLALEHPPDLVLLDAEMPGMSGFEVCEALKAEPGLSELPVVFVTAHGEPEFEVAGFAIGASDFIAKPVHADLVRARVQAQLRHKQMADRLRRLTRLDASTGLINRAACEELLGREWRRAQREATPICLLLLEVDALTSYAERHGEGGAEAALSRVGAALSQGCARPGDAVARWDAQRFALLLPNTPRQGGFCLAHRLLNRVEGLAIAHPDSGVARHLTLSGGLACHDSESPGWRAAASGARAPASVWRPQQLLMAAQAALGAARHAGRAQAWWLDIADHDDAERARELPAPN